jgi:hypothetical protein
MSEFKKLPILEATTQHPAAIVDADFFCMLDQMLCIRIDDGFGSGIGATQIAGVVGMLCVSGADGAVRRLVACLQARLWSDYTRRYLGEKLKNAKTPEETRQLHTQATQARDVECMWLVWGWDPTDYPRLAGRDKYAAPVPVPPGCC